MKHQGCSISILSEIHENGRKTYYILNSLKYLANQIRPVHQDFTKRYNQRYLHSLNLSLICNGVQEIYAI